MKRWKNRTALIILAALFAQATNSQLLWGRQPSKHDREAELERKINRGTPPIRKAKLQIDLARLRLDKSLKAYADLKIKSGTELLKTYSRAIQDAGYTLQNSGRNAARQPKGFKDLEIAIRRDIRVLEDLRRRVPFNSREEIRSIIDRVDQVREQILEAMFNSSEAGLRPAPFLAEGTILYTSWIATAAAPQTDAADLSPPEEDQLRRVQDAGKRISVYLQLGATRIDKFEEFRPHSGRTTLEHGPYLNTLLNNYVACINELKDWMEYQYDKEGDMRKGLQVLLKQGPVHLDRLRRSQRFQDKLTDHYAKTLQYAIENLEDTLEGGALALSEQRRIFKEQKKTRKEGKGQAKRNNKNRPK